jgi:hypothetical protein
LRRAVAIIGTAMLSLALTLGTAGAAHADPYDCSTIFWTNGEGTQAKCYNGTGRYRAVALCNRTWPRKDYTVYGDWVLVGKWSSAWCGNGRDAIKKDIQFG